jgi:hypothetical protein
MVIILTILFSSNLKAEETNTNTKSKKNNINLYIGQLKNSIDVDFANSSSYNTNKKTSINTELSYSYSLSNDFRLGLGFVLNNNQQDYYKTINTTNSFEFEEIEFEEQGSINLQAEYDIYKINKFAIFGFANLGLSFYEGSYDYSKYTLITDNNYTYFRKFSEYEAEYKGNSLNYGIGIGGNYAIKENIKFSSKISYNQKQSTKLKSTKDNDSDDIIFMPPSSITEPEVKVNFKGNVGYMLGLIYSF